MSELLHEAARKLSLLASDIESIIGPLVAAHLILQIGESDPWDDVKRLSPLPLIDEPEFGGGSNEGQADKLKPYYDLWYDLWLRFDGRTTLEAAVRELIPESGTSFSQAQRVSVALLFSLVRAGAVLVNPANKDC
jgi:hypothetical protein